MAIDEFRGHLSRNFTGVVCHCRPGGWLKRCVGIPDVFEPGIFVVSFQISQVVGGRCCSTFSLIVVILKIVKQQGINRKILIVVFNRKHCHCDVLAVLVPITLMLN